MICIGSLAGFRGILTSGSESRYLFFFLVDPRGSCNGKGRRKRLLLKDRGLVCE